MVEEGCERTVPLLDHLASMAESGGPAAAADRRVLTALAEWLDVDAVAGGRAPPSAEGVEPGAEGPSQATAETTLLGPAISMGPLPSAEPGPPVGPAHWARRDGSSGVELDVVASRW